MTTTAPTQGMGPPPKRLIRNYLLNPQFQLKYAGMLIAVAVALMGSLGGIVIHSANTAAEQAQEAVGAADYAAQQTMQTAELARIAASESQSTSRVLAMQRMVDHPELQTEIERTNREAEQAANARVAAADDQLRRARIERSKASERKAKIENTRRQITLSLVIGGLVVSLVLGALGIVITHRVVGPVFKMKRLLRKVGTGKLDIQERLRKGDELGDLFEVFLEMVQSLKQHQQREIASLDAALKNAERAGAPATALEPLRVLQEEMKVALQAPEPTGTFDPNALGGNR